jgi:hypothetical protein
VYDYYVRFNLLENGAELCHRVHEQVNWIGKGHGRLNLLENGAEMYHQVHEQVNWIGKGHGRLNLLEDGVVNRQHGQLEFELEGSEESVFWGRNILSYLP